MSKTANAPTPAQTQAENDQRSFDEWMKIAADNKITATNTWNLGLINIFHDLTLLREGDSINFQKASCTLDGCVKIYTSRVDSVDADTRVLLNGLVDGRGGGNDEDGAGGEDAKRSRRAKGNTLEKDISALNVKKIDAEFLIDPLFKKTSADFDEGTASGLLLSHLNMTNEGMIIFDASDDVTVSKQMADIAEISCESQQQLVDISKLKEKFMYDMSGIRSLDICPSLKSFDFSSGNNEMPKFDFDDLMNSQVPLDTPIHEADYEIHENDLISTGGTGRTDFVDEFDDDQFQDDDDGDNGSIHNGDGHYDESGQFQARQGHGGLVGATGKSTLGFGMDTMDGDNAENPFSYFDSRMVRRWAGPEHWKPKPIIKAKYSTAAPRKKREPLKIDFFNISEKQIFAASTVSTVLPKYNDKSKLKNILPSDEHFSATDFLKLFLKPSTKIVFRKKNGGGFDGASQLQENPVDPAFWSQHQNDDVSFSQEPTSENLHDGNNNYDENDFGNIHDMDDDDGDDFPSQLEPDADTNGARGSNALDGASLEYGDLLVAAPKKIKANFIHFAKTQKKVDIKRLKENLWSNLIDLTGDDDEDAPASTSPKTETNFKEVMHGLSNRYSGDKMRDISVAFCFICLLHLANEKNLAVVSDMDQNNLKIKVQT
ncbi:condensin complex subunit 2/barren [Chytriomyces cf. hyalinus JEL632]|nr:condensin complex subunit 2/barren [Chytriomyces cf. hyalinus JEL632]